MGASGYCWPSVERKLIHALPICEHTYNYIYLGLFSSPLARGQDRKGATGFAVATLVEWALSQAA